MNEWYTVNQAAEETGIPGETVRRYVRQYGDYLRLSRGVKRSYLIHKQSLDVIKQIRALLDQGKQKAQVEEILQQTEPLTVQTNDDTMNEYMMNLPQMQRETVKRMNEIAEQMEKQTKMIDQQSKVIQELSARLDQQQDYIENNLKERDKVLLHAIDERLSEHREVAAGEEKKSFFTRLFGR